VGAWGLALVPQARAEALADDPVFHAGAATTALGGAVRASAADLDNIRHCVAALALEPRYDLRGDGWLAPGGWSGFKVSGLDSRTSQVALGVSYSWARNADMALSSSELPGWQLPDESEENLAVTHHLSAGLAATDAQRRFSFGLQGGYWWRRAALAGDGGGWRLGASAAARPHETLTVALGGGLALAVTEPRGIEDLPWLEGGLRWQPDQDLALLLDGWLPLRDTDGLDFSLGGEWSVASLVPFRVGWHRAAGDVRHSLGTGLGLNSDALNLHYGLWLDLGPMQGDQERDKPSHTLSLAIQF